MSYLRLIRNNIQGLAETVASVLGVEVAVADKNLIRLVGTGNFYDKLDKNCPEDSLFARVIETGDYIINLDRSENCIDCSHKDDCMEFANMSYPIKQEGKIVGVVSFASFDPDQTNIIRLKKQEYFNMLKETAWIIEQDLVNLKIANQLEKDLAEVNEIINCLNKAIIIINCNKEIININSRAAELLEVNLSEETIIGKKIDCFIKNIEYVDSSKDRLALWNIKGKDIRVIYNVNKLAFRDGEYSLMLSFDFMEDIINIARTNNKIEEVRFSNIIGQSRSMLKIIAKSKIAAKTDSTILLEGESGTGKELFARSIHNESNRNKGPFIVINCGSIPENLIESELFGYEKGAFTGASLSGKKGKIELANNGTLFLDEIGDLPLHMQTRLLRVLQDKTVSRLGSEKSTRVNIRIISATNKNLIELVKKGKFRLDLYYRLNVIPINLPPLREREKDVLLCSDFIIDNFCQKLNTEKKQLSREVREKFLNYPWYGNIRELENVIEHGVCFSNDEYIKLDDLPDYFIEGSFQNINQDKLNGIGNKSLEELTEDFQRDIITSLIDLYGDDVETKKKIADLLDISVATLYRKVSSKQN